MHVQLIAKRESRMSGTLRYASDLQQGFVDIGLRSELTFPSPMMIPLPILRSLRDARMDLQSFFDNYPLHARLNGADIYHLTGQMLATLLLFQRFPKPVVVSVLDIIPYLVREQPDMNTLRHPGDRFFYRLALAGLQRAEALIAISNYTRQTLIDALHILPRRIHVVYPGTNFSRFRVQEVRDGFWSKYGLEKANRYVLFVGSEDPRKNLVALIQAFSHARREVPALKLLKVGPPQYTQERQRLTALVRSLDLQDDVIFLNSVPEEDLPLFYNAAEVLFMPSLYEGFGLPVLEAMACGTPVIYAKAGSLPEVAGGAGIAVDPYDLEGMAEALLRLLDSSSKKAELKQAGLEQATKFTLERTACTVRDIYGQLISQR